MRVPYKEGDWFAVPIKSGYVLARIVRAKKTGGSLLGYFFEPLYKSVPTAEDTIGLKASSAFNIAKFGYLGLVKDNWPIIHRPDTWNRGDWPMPPFGRLNDFVPGRGFVSVYDEDQLERSLSERGVTAEEAMQYPSEGLAGHVYLQNVLERYFTVGLRPYDPSERKRAHIWFHGLPDIKYGPLADSC